jgi:hypothetical protein
MNESEFARWVRASTVAHCTRLETSTVSGLPDMLIITHRRVHLIELKAQRCLIRPHQLAWMAQIYSAVGYRTMLLLVKDEMVSMRLYPLDVVFKSGYYTPTSSPLFCAPMKSPKHKQVDEILKFTENLDNGIVLLPTVRTT